MKVILFSTEDILYFISNKSETLPVSTTKNISCLGISPDGNLAILIDEGMEKSNHSPCIFFPVKSSITNVKTILKIIPFNLNQRVNSLRIMKRLQHKMLITKQSCFFSSLVKLFVCWMCTLFIRFLLMQNANKCHITDTASFLCQQICDTCHLNLVVQKVRCPCFQ